MSIVDETVKSCADLMSKAKSHLEREIVGLRASRASTALIEGVMVDYYGAQTPLKQVATLAVPDPSLITAQPWDVSMIPLIEKAILASDLGLNPSNDGSIIRLSVPPLTQERRAELVKRLKKIGEESKIGARNARRSGIEKLKSLEKDVSTDDIKRGQEQIQKALDGVIAAMDKIIEEKERDIMG